MGIRLLPGAQNAPDGIEAVLKTAPREVRFLHDIPPTFVSFFFFWSRKESN